MRWLALVAILGGCDKLFGLVGLPWVDSGPPPPPVLEPVAAGCGLRGTTIYCWGQNESGQLVDGTGWRTTMEPVP